MFITNERLSIFEWSLLLKALDFRELSIVKLVSGNQCYRDTQEPSIWTVLIGNFKDLIQ